MRPGEVIPGEGPAVTTPAARQSTVTVHNTGRTPAYLGSHFPLIRASGSLELNRDGLEDARLDLPAGATVRIAAGKTVDVPIRWDT